MAELERFTPSTPILRDKDLQFLVSSPQGQLIIRLVGEKDWTTILSQQDALRILATQCVLCGVRQSRPQNLNQHLRQYYPEYMDQVLTKTAQLFAARNTGSPCAACGSNFKTSHQCLAWTQLALLPLNLPPALTRRQETKQQIALTCELCRVRFWTSGSSRPK